MFRPFADCASRQWFRECIRWILLTCNNIQLQVTKRHSTLQPQMTCPANVSDVLRFLVFLQHFLLLSCHCRFVLKHQSSSLDNGIEFPSSYTLLQSKHNIHLLHFTIQQASANMTCVETNVCFFSRSHLSCFSFKANLQPNQSTHAPATLHLTFVVHTSTRISCSSPGIDPTF